MSLIYGVGINDSTYRTSKTVNCKRVVCKFYMTWRSMLQRCYDEKLIKRSPRYKDCYVHKDWHYFMTFRSWMMTQDWEGKQLDKDLLVKGNKIYSPETCVFISNKINSFITDSQKDEISQMGVYKDGNRYRSTIANPEGKSTIYLGMYDTPEEANLAYRLAKSSQAKSIAMTTNNKTVADALLSRYEVYDYDSRGLL